MVINGTMNKGYLSYITPLRVFATFFVIALHVASNYRTNLPELSSAALNGYNIIVKLWPVPLFVMISGALLLHPDKTITYKDIFGKYCLRIIRAIILFGLPMCLIESAMTPGYSITEIAAYSVLNLVMGHCWTHMWYLYMLLGLYLLTPMFRAFIKQASRRDLEYLILSLFFLCYVTENMNFWFTEHYGSYMNLPFYLFLYPLGYYLRAYIPATKPNVSIAILCLALSLLVTCLMIHWDMPFVYGPSILQLVYAISLFVSFKVFSKPIHGLRRIDRCCFGIYLVHAVILNIFFKGLHICQYININSWLNIIIVSSIAFAIAYLVTYALRQIPYMKNKVL